MPRKALINHRPWLLASLIASVSYFFVSDGPIPGLWLAVWKGAGVALLAGYAWQRARGVDGVLIGMVMALGAIADMALEFDLLIGGLIFAAGHAVAIWLYWRNRRPAAARSQQLAGWALLLLTPAIAMLLVYPLPNWRLAAAYALVVGAMAAAAWTSRFPRYRVGMGAVLFLVSDLVIFASEGQRLDPAVAGWLVWPLYYAGQFMIATGVVQTLRREKVAE